MLRKEDFTFKAKGNRPLHIYLPDNYDQSKEHYPVMYYFDGHNLFEDSSATYGTSWGLKDFLATWPKKLIGVGIECGHGEGERLHEYSPYTFEDTFLGQVQGCGQETFAWLIKEVKPYIDRQLRTLPHREATGLAGSSMGGLMSFYGVIMHNATFSKAACLSSATALCQEKLSADLKMKISHLSPDTRIYMSMGEQEGQMQTLQHQQAILRDLATHGIATNFYYQDNGSHNESSWAQQNQIYLDFLWRS